MISSIVQTAVGLALSFVLYRFFLKREKTFEFNRFYLLGSVFLCLVVPLLQIELNNPLPLISQVDFDDILVANDYSNNSLEITTVDVLTRDVSFFQQVVTFLYLFFTAIFIFRFLKNLFKVYTLIMQKLDKVDGLKIVKMPEVNEPFSFFNYLFIGLDSKKNQIAQSVIEHERAHSKQLHSLDIIFIEIICCFFWFNPFIWLFRKAIVENHEYLADKYVVEFGINIDSYTNKIIQSGNKNHNIFLTSGFSFAKTKNRLIMLHKPKSSNLLRVVKIFSVIILFVLGIIVSSFTQPLNKTTFKVIIDAGHGGVDTGNFNEKEITLNISKKLLELSEDSGIEVVLLRNEDKFVSLADRVKFVNTQQADLLLSLHCDSFKNNKVKGVTAFYYPKGRHQQSSYNYSKLLIAEQLKTTFEGGKINTAGFLILKNTVNCPSVLLELGFLSNENDKRILNDPKGQEQIASSILDGLLKIKESQK